MIKVCQQIVAKNVIIFLVISLIDSLNIMMYNTQGKIVNYVTKLVYALKLY